MLDSAALDQERLEWEFQRAQKEHRHCCAGAMLIEGMWVALILRPAWADDEDWQDWDPE